MYENATSTTSCAAEVNLLFGNNPMAGGSEVDLEKFSKIYLRGCFIQTVGMDIIPTIPMFKFLTFLLYR